MDILTQAEIVLRDAQYETWVWEGGVVPAVCFENQAIMGFLHVFSSAEELLATWEKAQEISLSRHRAALRSSGNKAWNIYSVFISHEFSQNISRRIERIEEDFALSRKIARIGIQTASDLSRAILPLLPIKAQPKLENADYEQRLRTRLKDIPDKAVDAFIGEVPPVDVAHILEEES
jgi:hypothetical protein